MSDKIVTTSAKQTRARHHVALLGRETGGQLSMRVTDTRPGDGTPLHLHRDQAETFHVVRGRFRFQIGDEEVSGGPGFTAHIPKGTPHCFTYLDDDAPGQLISVLTPGIHDGFIEEVPIAQENGLKGPALAELAKRHGVEILR